MFLLLATQHQNARRFSKVESTTQRTHERRNAGRNGESLQRQRVGNASRVGLEHQHGGADRHNKAKNKIKRNAKRRKGEKMKMLIEIFKNGEKVNEITSTEPTEIYKKIAQIYNAKESGRTTRTTIKTGWNTIQEVTETYNQNKTQINGVSYKYKYYFDGVEL